MTRDEAMKVRNAVFDEAAKIAKLLAAIKSTQQQEARLREEYNAASNALIEARRKAEAAEAEAIADEVRTSSLVDAVEAIKA